MSQESVAVEVVETEAATTADPAVEVSPDKPSLGDSHDKAVEALREARKARPAEESKPATAQEAKGEPAESKEPTAEPELKGIAKVLRDRESKAQPAVDMQRERDEFARMRADFERERDSVRKEREQMNAWAKMVREDPVRAIRDLGRVDTDELVVRLAKDGTPEGQLMRQVSMLQDRLSQYEERFGSFEKNIQSREAEAQQAAASAQREHTERAFVGVAMSDKFPALAKAFKGREHILVSEGHRVGAAFHEATGKWATHEDLAEYLNDEWRSALGMIDSNQPAEAAGVNGKAPQARAAGSRTVTTAAASERRTGPGKSAKELLDASDEERREAAIAAAREARSSRA